MAAITTICTKSPLKSPVGILAIISKCCGLASPFHLINKDCFNASRTITGVQGAAFATFQTVEDAFKQPPIKFPLRNFTDEEYAKLQIAFRLGDANSRAEALKVCKDPDEFYALQAYAVKQYNMLKDIGNRPYARDRIIAEKEAFQKEFEFLDHNISRYGKQPAVTSASYLVYTIHDRRDESSRIYVIEKRADGLPNILVKYIKIEKADSVYFDASDMHCVIPPEKASIAGKDLPLVIIGPKGRIIWHMNEEKPNFFPFATNMGVIPRTDFCYDNQQIFVRLKQTTIFSMDRAAPEKIVSSEIGEIQHQLVMRNGTTFVLDKNGLVSFEKGTLAKKSVIPFAYQYHQLRQSAHGLVVIKPKVFNRMNNLPACVTLLDPEAADVPHLHTFKMQAFCRGLSENLDFSDSLMFQRVRDLHVHSLWNGRMATAKDAFVEEVTMTAKAVYGKSRTEILVWKFQEGFSPPEKLPTLAELVDRRSTEKKEEKKDG